MNTTHRRRSRSSADKWGVEKFMKKKTGRFVDAKTNKKETPAKILKAKIQQSPKSRRKYQNKAPPKKQFKNTDPDSYYDATRSCKVKKENSMFITAEGLALFRC